MPFTFSHPAFILPFRFIQKKYFSITGLVIGSMAPDFEYFFRLKNSSRFSHTWAGVIWFDIPVALLISFIFHHVVKGHLILNSPYFLHVRLIKFYNFNWNKYLKTHMLIVLYSILIGIVTHFIADRITHKSFYFVTLVPDLRNLRSVAYHPLRVYRVFQSVYSTVGILLVLLTIWYLPVNKGLMRYKPDMRFWLLVGGIFTSAFTMIIMTRNTLYVDYVISSITSMLIAIFLSSVIMTTMTHGQRLMTDGRVV